MPPKFTKKFYRSGRSALFFQHTSKLAIRISCCLCVSQPSDVAVCVYLQQRNVSTGHASVRKCSVTVSPIGIMHRDGDRSRVALSGTWELPWCHAEHLFEASGWTRKNVLLDSLLMPGGLWPFDPKENLDFACPLLRCEVLDLVLYMNLRIQERRAGQIYCVYSANMKRIITASLIFHMMRKDMLLIFVTT